MEVKMSYTYYGDGWYRLSDGTFAKRKGSETYLCPCFFDDVEGNQHRLEELNEILKANSKKKIRVFNWRRV